MTGRDLSLKKMKLDSLYRVLISEIAHQKGMR